eukprot:7982547-Ditylum_brightwellii.AAC.1
MTGVKMHNTLLDIFQGLEHDEDTALNATAIWEQLKFNRYTKYSAETLLAKMNDCLKKMEVDDGTGRTSKPFGNAMLPSLLRAKVDHTSFNTCWKALSEKDREDWPTIQVSFLRATERNLTVNHDTSSKFRTANQRSEGRETLTDKEKKIFKEAHEKGEGVPSSICDKLTRKEKSELIKAKREKKAQNNGGLGS